ncbi:MAG: peptidyl-prolyl cis-trans isomerase, partial [Alphaproteobacteria bacterium]
TAIIIQQVLNKDLSELIIQRIAKKYNVFVSDELVRKIIFSQPEFQNEIGQFDLTRMRRILAISGMNEASYIKRVRDAVMKQHLVESPLEEINVPNIMAKYMAQAENQKKIFEYIKIDINKVKIDRQISDEEVNQYYQDFIVNFTKPETRDVSFIFINNHAVEKNYNPSDEEITEVYKENIEKYETAEKRDVLQIIVADEATATEAKKAIASGTDFYAAADKFAKQSKNDTELGLISADMLSDEISGKVFAAQKNVVVGPFQSDLGWHLIKVTDVKSSTKVPFEKAKQEIVSELRKDKAYETARGMNREIEDQIGAGADLETLAKDSKLQINKISGLTEDGTGSISPEYKFLLQENDFVDTAFSYNVKEVSQVIETNEGFAVLSVDKITEAHPRDVNEVRGQIEKIWAENERAAITQEIINDVLHYVENGDDIKDVAQRFKLAYKQTQPIKRSENFENIGTAAINQLFLENYGTAKLIEDNNIKIIAVSKPANLKISNVSVEDTQKTRAMLQMGLTKEYQQNLINNYGEDYDVRVKYRLLGLAE